MDAPSGLPTIYDHRMLQWLMTLWLQGASGSCADRVCFGVSHAALDLFGGISGSDYRRAEATLVRLRETRVSIVEIVGDDRLRSTFHLISDYRIQRGPGGVTVRLPAFLRRKLRDPDEVLLLDRAAYDVLPPLVRALWRFVLAHPELRRGQRFVAPFEDVSRAVGSSADLKSFGVNLRKALARATDLFPETALRRRDGTMILDLRLGKALHA